MKTKMKLVGVALIASSLTVTGALAGSGPLTPLYETYYGGYTDTFLTTSVQTKNIVVNQYGYQDLGIVGYVSKFSGGFEGPSSDWALPFARYFKGAPQVEHFYTTSQNEQNIISSDGYALEGVEGNLFTSVKVLGLVPLVRLSKFNNSNGDLVHKWTTNSSLVNSLISQGWIKDGTAGYVWPPSSKTEGGRILATEFASNRNVVVTRGYCTNSIIGCPQGLGLVCPEKADIYIDDVFTGTLSSSYVTTGPYSGGCAAAAAGLERPTFGPPKKVRVELSGYAGTFSYVAPGNALPVGAYVSEPPAGVTTYIYPLL